MRCCSCWRRVCNCAARLAQPIDVGGLLPRLPQGEDRGRHRHEDQQRRARPNHFGIRPPLRRLLQLRAEEVGVAARPQLEGIGRPIGGLILDRADRDRELHLALERRGLLPRARAEQPHPLVNRHAALLAEEQDRAVQIHRQLLDAPVPGVGQRADQQELARPCGQ